jgi:hypothetical protein
MTYRLAQGRQFQIDVTDQFFAARSAGQTISPLEQYGARLLNDRRRAGSGDRVGRELREVRTILHGGGDESRRLGIGGIGNSAGA